jgi:multicomponent Na+:H+ antiporter subunit E
MMRYGITVAWLTAVWVALWEELTWANLLAGLAVAVLVVLAVPLRPAVADHGLRPLALAWLGAYFMWKLVEASALLAWEVVTPRNRINAAIVSVPLRTRSIGIAVMVANMVSLTPGTLTLELDPETMTIYIHVLHLSSVEAMRDSVLYLEKLAMKALPLRRTYSDRPLTPGEAT